MKTLTVSHTEDLGDVPGPVIVMKQYVLLHSSGFDSPKSQSGFSNNAEN